jgi:nucleoside-diphosphate-sugar epimerase
MKKKILILGSEGQIGSYLLLYLKQKGYDVFGYDIVNSNKQDLRLKNNKYFIKLIKKTDFIFFLAFDVGGSRYLKIYQDNYKFISNNILIMENTFLLIKKYKKKFIFASSQMSNMNFSNYGILKRVGESYTKALGGITVKLWNVYGIEKDLNKAHVITDFITNGFTSKKVKMLTNGKEERNFLYVKDCCEALELIMKNFYKFFKKNQLIDLASNRSHSILHTAKIIKNLFLKNGKSVQYVPSNQKDTVQLDSKNKFNKFIFNFWKPKFSLEEGIKEIFKYYMESYLK